MFLLAMIKFIEIKLNSKINYNHKSKKSQKKSDFFHLLEIFNKKCTHFGELSSIKPIKLKKNKKSLENDVNFSIYITRKSIPG